MNKAMNTSLAVSLLAASAAAFSADATAPVATELPTMTVQDTATDEYAVPSATTGTKTDTPLMETPLSIQVVPQQVLQDQAVTTLDQALTNVSGVRSRSGGLNWESTFLRGFSTLTTFHNGFRIDDLFGFGQRTLTNVESIEVLKGPAAILYGRVEPGGIVNLVTKQPLATPYYSIEQQVGSWNQYLTSVDATGPVNSDRTLRYRLSASYQNNGFWRDGIQDNKFFVSPAVSWDISPRTQVNLEAEYTHSPEMGYDAGQGAPYDPATGTIIWLPRDRNLAKYQHMSSDTSLVELNGVHQFSDQWSIKLQADRFDFHQLPGSTWYWLAGFSPGTTNAWNVDRGGSGGDGHWTTTASILDLTGHFRSAGLEHTVLLGADYYRYRVTAHLQQASGIDSTDAFNPAPITDLPMDPALAYYEASTTNNTGVYVQDQIRLPHGVQVLAGWRWQQVNRDGSYIDATGVNTPDAHQSDSATTPRYGILWQASDQLSFYGNYAENFGANNGRDWQNQLLPPESGRQEEIGAKAQFLDGRLSSSLALYDLTKTNVAVCDLAHDPSCLAGILMTVGEVRSRGTEFDIQGAVRPGWNLIATYTYTDIVVTHSTSPPGGTYVQGNRMPNVPRNMGSLWSTYGLDRAGLSGMKVGAGITAYSSATDSSNAFTVPGYAVTNAMASYEFTAARTHVTLQLNVNNLLTRVITRISITTGSMASIGSTGRRALSGQP